ncbi:hypothetical protein ACOMHN_026493 [Nucella lapillus]
MGRGWAVSGAVALTVMFCLSVLWPQPGYIHPDEFFQSTEIVAGDIFNISHLRTWEFNPDLPLRDITVPYLLYAPGFYSLRWVLASLPASHHIVESYALLVVPRLVLALAAVTNLCLVLKLCAFFAVSKGTALWFWLTSYVTWTFLLRPFSNTSETLLFSVVCILLLDTLPCYRKSQGLAEGEKSLLMSQQKQGLCEERELVSQDEGDKSQPAHQQKQEASTKGKASPLTNQPTRKVSPCCCFLLGVVLCTGFFNRPTFALFAVVPLLWWADQLRSRFGKISTVVSVLSLMGFGFLLSFVGLCVSNSLYYNPEFGHLLKDVYGALLEFDADALLPSVRAVVSGLRVPPWSFLQYNMAAVNLAEHGLHPWYTHLLVHMPTLLGPLVLLLYPDLLRLVVHFRRGDCAVLYAAVMIPVFALSLFPHQEARFLLPILPFAAVCVARHPLASWKSVRVVSLVFNVLGLTLFGCLHQGGVVPALSALQGRLKKEAAQPSNQGARFHIISYSTYMPPRHLLFVNPSDVNLVVDDMIGAHNHPPTLRVRMEKRKAACVKDSVPCRFWVLLPAPALVDLATMEGWGVKEEGEFCPHVSMERLPSTSKAGVRTWEDVRGLVSQLCLKVVSVTL